MPIASLPCLMAVLAVLAISLGGPVASGRVRAGLPLQGGGPGPDGFMGMPGMMRGPQTSLIGQSRRVDLAIGARRPRIDEGGLLGQDGPQDRCGKDVPGEDREEGGDDDQEDL